VPAADCPGDLLLFAVSAWGQATRDQVRHACDWLGAPAGTGEATPLARHTRAAALRALIALGHCNPTPDGGLAALPAHLAELPRAGLPQALLCGARTPGTQPGAAGAAARAGAQLHVQAQPFRLAPARLLLTGASRRTLRQVAATLGLEYRPTPAAWAALSGDRETQQTQQEKLSWAASAELNWPRRDFDTDSCTFSSPQEGAGRDWRLSSYLHPDTQQPRYVLWKGERSAQTDRDWGRYLALYHRRRTVLGYSPEARTAWSPTSAPLPAPLARALAQCTGLLPASRPHPMGDAVSRWDIHEGVPPDVFEEVRRRLAPNR